MYRHLLVVCGLLACRDAEPRRSQTRAEMGTPAAPERAFRCTVRASDNSCARFAVPLAQLLARPLEFRGDEVSTEGYAVLGPSGLSHLFPTHADREGGLLVNSIALILPSDSVANRLSGRLGYVSVRGRYDTLSAAERKDGFWTTGIHVSEIYGVRDSLWVNWINPNYQRHGIY